MALYNGSKITKEPPYQTVTNLAISLVPTELHTVPCAYLDLGA